MRDEPPAERVRSGRDQKAGVVVPAHDEQERLPACLAALRGIPVVVVADACTDRTAEVARRYGAQVVEIAARNVGAARAAGVRALLRRGVSWVATTDADTLVPPGWLASQLRYAARGWDAVVGTVEVTDWTGHEPRRIAAYARHYARDPAPVHGANLGFSAHAYVTSGGFPPLRTGEDRALVAAMTAAGHRVLHTPQVRVITSARHRYRAPHGFGHFLTTLG
ncbi:glycosyltransferase family 2 protein [Actinoallomurus oryzae]|uniref:glycosyltransferase n=1 Tax=Actinoallomurus oryzae TaxID=502180 RepID=UPI0031EC1CE0